jgi:DNA-directed RNA polymerase specialized sigma subunit
MPEQVALDQMRMNEAITELTDRLGRPPSDRELAEFTGLSTARLEHIRLGQKPVAEGTSTQLSAEGGGGYDPAVTGLGPDSIAWLDFVYEDLDPVNQYIMERAFGMHGHDKMTPGEIATALKLSPGAISQRMAKIQAEIDDIEDLGML